MKQITTKTLRDANWHQIYEYVGKTIHFNVFACDELPGLTITHSREIIVPRYLSATKTKTTYAIKGRRTDSVIQAIKMWNNQVKRVLQDH